MRTFGIDIASKTHVIAAVNDEGEVILEAKKFEENGEGHALLLQLLGNTGDALVVMEATGHYWKNLFIRLSAEGFRVAVVNPLAVQRFGESMLKRAKTDASDALLIARFGRSHQPRPTSIPDEALENLRELVRLRDRWVQDVGDRVRQLHRFVDLGFPELKTHIDDLSSRAATAILTRYPTAAALRQVKPSTLLKATKDAVSKQVAADLIAAAKTSAGMHHGEAYQLGVRTTCEDIAVLRSRISELDKDIHTKLNASELGSLLQTIGGIGPTTAARIIAEFGDPAHYASADAFAAHFGVVPAISQSGKTTTHRAGITNLGDTRLRAKMWMPALVAIRVNPWLKAFYERLCQAGKPHKLALTAAMRKLITAIYSVAKNRKPFEPRLPESSQNPC